MFGASLIAGAACSSPTEQINSVQSKLPPPKKVENLYTVEWIARHCLCPKKTVEADAPCGTAKTIFELHQGALNPGGCHRMANADLCVQKRCQAHRGLAGSPSACFEKSSGRLRCSSGVHGCCFQVAQFAPECHFQRPVQMQCDQRGIGSPGGRFQKAGAAFSAAIAHWNQIISCYNRSSSLT